MLSRIAGYNRRLAVRLALIYGGVAVAAIVLKVGLKHENSGMVMAGGTVLVILGLAGEIGLFWVVLLAARLVNKRLHPAWRRLKRWGDPERVAAALESAVAHTPPLFQRSYLVITRDWTVAFRKWTLDAVPTGRIVWAYAHEFSERVNGVTTRRIWSVVCQADAGAAFKVGLAGQDEALEALRTLAGALPGLVVGYGAEAQARWHADRAGFAKAVLDQRRAAAAPPDGADLRARLERSAAEGERYYTLMYDGPQRDLKDNKDEAIHHLGDALAAARELGLADRVTALAQRIEHVRQVYRQLSV